MGSDAKGELWVEGGCSWETSIGGTVTRKWLQALHRQDKAMFSPETLNGLSETRLTDGAGPVKEDN